MAPELSFPSPQREGGKKLRDAECFKQPFMLLFTCLPALIIWETDWQLQITNSTVTLVLQSQQSTNELSLGFTGDPPAVGMRLFFTIGLFLISSAFQLLETDVANISSGIPLGIPWFYEKRGNVS